MFGLSAVWVGIGGSYILSKYISLIGDIKFGTAYPHLKPQGMWDINKNDTTLIKVKFLFGIQFHSKGHSKSYQEQ